MAAAEAPTVSASVRLVLADRLEQTGTTIAIIRQKGRVAENTMLITPAASPRDLAQAYEVFAVMRARIGDDLYSEMRGFIRPVSENARVDSALTSQAAEDLERLRFAPYSDVPGVGRARATNASIAAKRRASR